MIDHIEKLTPHRTICEYHCSKADGSSLFEPSGQARFRLHISAFSDLQSVILPVFDYSSIAAYTNTNSGSLSSFRTTILPSPNSLIDPYGHKVRLSHYHYIFDQVEPPFLRTFKSTETLTLGISSVKLCLVLFFSGLISESSQWVRLKAPSISSTF